NSPWSDLDGAVNDVNRAAQVLIERFGFREGDVTVLTDTQATHEGIVRAFYEKLIQPAQSDTEALFWYSGHGSRLPDASGVGGSELDGMDSTFIAYDSRDGIDEFDITDDEIHSLLAALCRKTPNVTVVTDCCHSGGITRGPAAGKSRSAEAGKSPVTETDLADFWPPDVPFLEDGDPRRGPLPYTAIYASSSRQTAKEISLRIPGREPKSHGAMTWFFLSALEEAKPGTTYRDLVRSTALKVAEYFPDQDVQAEGELDRMFLAADFSAPPPGFAGILQPDGMRVDIEAGHAHFMKRDTLLEIQDISGKILGKARANRVFATHAVARVEGGPLKYQSAIPVRVVELERPSGDDPFPVYVGQSSLENALAQSLSRRGKDIVEILREPLMGNGYQALITEQGALALWTAGDGVPLWEEGAITGSDAARGARAADGILEFLKTKESRFRNLWSLASQPGNIPIQGSFQAPSKDFEQRTGLSGVVLEENKERGFAQGSSESGFAVNIPKGEKPVIGMQLGIPSDAQAAHLTVLVVSENRDIDVIYPAPGNRSNRFEPGENRIEHWRVKIDRWDLTRPMRDRYLIIATESWQDFHSLVQKGKVEKTRGGGVPPILAQAFTKERTRGGPSTSPRNQGFGVMALDLQLRAVSSP
ncbi:MAG TPA: hypothetical protein DDW23_02725, partial [Planctomycetes bacterium]|nr:hypothetical protein [Planctomycetota bacterium]